MRGDRARVNSGKEVQIIRNQTVTWVDKDTENRQYYREDTRKLFQCTQFKNICLHFKLYLSLVNFMFIFILHSRKQIFWEKSYAFCLEQNNYVKLPKIVICGFYKNVICILFILLKLVRVGHSFHPVWPPKSEFFP